VIVVAIDGPAGVGKSTLSRRLAVALGLPYLNTGLMYRAVTLGAIRRGVDLGDGQALARVAARLAFELRDGGLRELAIDGRAPEADLSSSAVEEAVSSVSAHPQVRAVLRDEQRRLSVGGAVVEGRDIGSVVRPDAEVKLFLTATADARAARRAGEIGDDASGAGRDEVVRALRTRDDRDAAVNPFVPAPDAVELDTTHKDADAVFEEALAIVRSRTGTTA
jgi:cytidylate kinase